MKKTIFLSLILFFLCLFVQKAMGEEVLTWGDCLAESKKNNPDLITAEESVNVQKASRAITGSRLLPQITGDADVSRARRSNFNNVTGDTISSTTGITTNVTRNSYTYGIAGSQLLFDGFKTYFDIKSDTQNIRASQYGYRFTSSDVRLRLRTAFINLLKAQELIKVAEEIVEIRDSNLKLIRLRYKSGLEHKGALMTAEANMADAKLELERAKRDVTLSQRQLTKEMGRKKFVPTSVQGDFVVAENMTEKPDLEKLAETNPSLLEASASRDAASFGVKAAYADFAPELLGTGGIDRTSADWPPDNTEWNVGLSLTVPIFEGGLKFAQASQAKALLRQAEAKQRSIRDGILVDLEQAWVELQNATQAVDVQDKTLLATEERSRIASAQYSTGFISFDNWIIIENDLVSAKKAYLNALANALYSEANWIKAKGETLEYAQ